MEGFLNLRPILDETAWLKSAYSRQCRTPQEMQGAKDALLSAHSNWMHLKLEELTPWAKGTIRGVVQSLVERSPEN